MRKLIFIGAICGLLCLTACFSSRSTTNTGTYNSANSPMPTTTVNTVSSTTAMADEYRDVKDPECVLYLKSLKVMTSCKTITDAQRKQFSDTYDKSLATFKDDIPNADARKLRVSICTMTDKAIQPLVTKCKS